MNISPEYIIAYIENRLPQKEKNAFEKQMQTTPTLRKEVD